ncbi:BREX-1 system phosphatase PglZ type B [Humisphaera borealis]|uniref:BREX-1 system phosphatase PglZ type B n=1 Tax=Humisphaera borealis TaxID=2807512 RepID=A0A7M2WV66_9BACT|nr:BREX-1 system phosphatase PglZ type B [Humisphaera borealis]QOV89375.1 BREX-1 system phosphatase PglZ type B [Humisphaera borealis]
MIPISQKPSTLIEAVQASLESAARHAPGEVAPTAILWPDADGQWLPLIPQLRALMPHLLVLGDYEPDQRIGPAIWLRCVIERALPEVPLPDRAVPVVYLPGVGRQTLRSIEDCPDPVVPLVELQYRGAVWCQRNGKDWTVEAFLVSEDSSMELDVAKDSQTRRAMLGALAQLAVTPLSRLRAKRLEAEDFDKLMIEDTPRNLLEWMSDPRGARERWDQGQWSAFRSRCKADYKFDPENDGELVAGERLGMREVEWLGVWQRFVEAPALYPGMPDLLRKAKPSGLVFVKETWPSLNDDAERALRKALSQLTSKNPSEARATVANLESEHGVRRQWVWAKLGQSPLAKALAHLAALVTRTAVGLGGDTPQAMADLYAQGGYLADDAVLRALAEVKSAEDCEAVSAATRAIYLSWVQDAAEHFQKVVAATPLPARGNGRDPVVEADTGTCILFVDGLRFDLGRRLAALAEDRKLRVGDGRRWAAVPTVTATAKPAVSPVAGQIIGHRLGEDFAPETADVGQPATTDRIRKLMAAAGYQCLGASEVGKPQDGAGRAWTEYGEFDSLGHNLQVKLANRIDEQLELLVERIDALLAAGWRQVRVVTDHGWLLVPGGLPNTPLPKYLTESRWSRCATVKAGSHVSVPTAGWYWNPTEIFAFGAGVSCFSKGHEYTHGGLSVQECVIPDLMFSSDIGTAGISANITAVQWLGMRCRVTVEPAGVSAKADVRTKVGDAGSSIVTPKAVDTEGKVGLLVEDESLEGTTVSVVLLDASGHVVAKRATSVGGEE